MLRDACGMTLGDVAALAFSRALGGEPKPEQQTEPRPQPKPSVFEDATAATILAAIQKSKQPTPLAAKKRLAVICRKLLAAVKAHEINISERAISLLENGAAEPSLVGWSEKQVAFSPMLSVRSRQR